MLPHHIYKLYEQSRRQRIADGTHCSMMGRRTDIMSSRSLCVCMCRIQNYKHLNRAQKLPEGKRRLSV